MKKQQVDTPYKNSWADRMARNDPALLVPSGIPQHITHSEEQKLMDARRSRGSMGNL